MGTLKSQYTGGRREAALTVLRSNDLSDPYTDMLRVCSRYHTRDAHVAQRAAQDVVRARLSFERSAAALHLQQEATRERLAAAADVGNGHGRGGVRRRQPAQRVPLGRLSSRIEPEVAVMPAAPFAGADLLAAHVRASGIEHAGPVGVADVREGRPGMPRWM